LHKNFEGSLKIKRDFYNFFKVQRLLFPPKPYPQMGTLAETAIVYYRLSFGNLGQQTFVSPFRLQQKETKEAFRFCFTFPISSHFSFAEFRKHGNMETWR
jgi:hypothetical protein